MSIQPQSTYKNMIRPESIQRVKDEADPVQVIGAFIELKKAGVNWKGKCPFHNEKSASFNVSPVRRTYKCFGCGAQGNVIDFVMQFKRLDFVDAIQVVASMENIYLEYDSPDRPKSRFHGIEL